MREAEVKGLGLDPMTRVPIVLLKDRHSDKVLPIWIGQAEAMAIAFVLQGQTTPRPMTHDLMKSILNTLGVRLEKVVINDLRENVYYATLYLRTSEGKVMEVDARPSDSIALALRTNSPIYIAEQVFDKSAVEIPGEEGEKFEVKKFEEFIDRELRLSEFKRFIE